MDVLGFRESTDTEWQPGATNVALFARDGHPMHAARQIEGGQWTSKLGSLQDIVHDLRAIEGDRYGNVAAIFTKFTLGL